MEHVFTGGFEHVKGYCPMGCGETLFLAFDGYVTCSYVSCPKPDAVSTILENRETEHLVTFKDSNFSILHPLRERAERLDGKLTECELHNYISMLQGPPVKPGVYRARAVQDIWTWEKVING